jgi:hypothetical protein
MISGFNCGVNESFTLLGCYAAKIGIYLPTFWDNLSVPSSRVKQSRKMGQLGCSETLVNKYQSTLRNIPEE